MAGYSGWSKSNNAIMAEEDKKFPLSRAVRYVSKEAGCTQKKARETLEEIGPCEWHHTSKMYNRTDYYDCNIAILMIKHPEVIEAIENFKHPDTTGLSFVDREAAYEDAFREHAKRSNCDYELLSQYYWEI